MQQKDVNCEGKIEVNCEGGSIDVLKALYSCQMRASSDPKHLTIVHRVCGNREACTVEATRETFGDEECPGEAKENMYLWITYRCKGNNFKDKTKVVGPRRCRPSTSSGKE